MDQLILHARLTTQCNADCSYCSSFDMNAQKYMPFNEFKQSIDWLYHKIVELNLGGKRRNLTIQYIGGEILALPKSYFEQCVFYAREKLKPLFIDFKDGVQTNLIASEEKVDFLVNLVGASNIGTSVDNFTNLRTIKGNATKYKTIFLKNHKEASNKYHSPFPAIIVVDENNYDNVRGEIEIASKQHYNLTLRPVFQGGKDNVASVNQEKLAKLYVELFDNWFLKQNILIQPFYQLLAQRIGEKFSEHQDYFKYNQGCPFQKDCAKSSIDLEPNGDIYICLDTADSHQLKLGNAVDNQFDYALWNKIQSRVDKLSQDCYQCPYFNSCQGGCMSEALHHTGDIFGKTHYCHVWKSLFALIDEKLNTTPINKILFWLTKSELKSTPYQD
jgi:radical SAM protein with 4Fe4S-binding SPASM domain